MLPSLTRHMSQRNKAAARLALQADGQRTPAVRFYATDSVEKFRTLGTRFLGRPIDGVELVELGG